MRFNQNLLLRILSSIILAPVAFGALWKGGFFFLGLLGGCFGLLCHEWIQLVRKTVWGLGTKVFCAIVGMGYAGFAFWTFWQLNFLPEGNFLLMAVLALVFASDTGGYLFGFFLKGPKLAPRISPNKTWSGSCGSFLLTWGVVQGLDFSSVRLFNVSGVLIAFGVSLVAQLGDLGESWVKRRFHVKDTGHLIPGHGGIIDRLDSLLAVGNVLGILRLFSLL